MIAEGVRLALDLIRKSEGLRLAPYLCPAGVPSIGYGSTYYLDGTPVTLADKPIKPAMAELLLLRTVQRVYLPAVLTLCPTVDTPGRLAALISFTYNLGRNRLKTSTLRRRVLEPNWQQVPPELRKWVYAAGKPLRGLVIRREAEAALI